MSRRHLRPGLLALTLAAAAPAASAQSAGSEASRAIRLSYTLYSHGFHVLNVVVDLRLSGQDYAVRLNDRTAGFLGLMLHTDVTSTVTGRFAAGGVRPSHFESAGYSRGAQRRTVLDYPDGNPTVRVLTPSEPRRDRVDPAQSIGSIDTLSAMADLVHQVQQDGRCDGHALVFDGLRLSQVSANTAGRQTVPQDARSPFGGAALRCDFVSLQTGGFLHNDEEARLREPQHGTAWVASVGEGLPALPVRITFENPKLGLATMFLTKIEPAPVGAGG